MQYKLIAMDLDGTLNNDQKIITEKTKASLMLAQQKVLKRSKEEAERIGALPRQPRRV